MGSNKKNLSVQWIRVTLLERFLNVLYPIDMAVLLRELPQIGYVVPRKVLKGVLELGEALAIKGDIELLINQDNKTIGVEGREVIGVIDSFKELRNFWLEKLNPSPKAETHYIEIGGQGYVLTDRNPMTVFGDFWADSKKIGVLGGIIGLDVMNFGLRLVSKDNEVNSPDWFDLRIQPQVISSENQYYVNLVWRCKDMQVALENFKKIDEITRSLAREVEK